MGPGLSTRLVYGEGEIMDAQYSRTVTMKVGYKFGVRELSTFLAEMERAGLDMNTAAITWTSYAGDQRDPAELTLKATEGP